MQHRLYIHLLPPLFSNFGISLCYAKNKKLDYENNEQSLFSVVVWVVSVKSIIIIRPEY